MKIGIYSNATLCGTRKATKQNTLYSICLLYTPASHQPSIAKHISMLMGQNHMLLSGSSFHSVETDRSMHRALCIHTIYSHEKWDCILNVVRAESEPVYTVYPWSGANAVRFAIVKVQHICNTSHPATHKCKCATMHHATAVKTLQLLCKSALVHF